MIRHKIFNLLIICKYVEHGTVICTYFHPWKLDFTMNEVCILVCVEVIQCVERKVDVVVHVELRALELPADELVLRAWGDVRALEVVDHEVEVLAQEEVTAWNLAWTDVGVLVRGDAEV